MGDQARVDVVRRFVEAFGRNDLTTLRALLDDGFTGHITTADGGARTVGPDDYVASVERMDVPSANLRLHVLNAAAVGDDLVLVMVEVHAARHGDTLHNYSGQLVRVVDGKLTDLWMVEALPAESDRFWSS